MGKSRRFFYEADFLPSPLLCCLDAEGLCNLRKLAAQFRDSGGEFGGTAAVSYTHLTLPTILRV